MGAISLNPRKQFKISLCRFSSLISAVKLFSVFEFINFIRFEAALSLVSGKTRAAGVIFG